jgi:hypothetical protein
MGSTGLGFVASGLLLGVAFHLASESFPTTGQPAPQAGTSRPPSALSDSTPTSALLGRVPEQEVASRGVDDEPRGDAAWVEVIDAVNMRSGNSSSDPVIKVQLEGERLRVASRDGGWLKVVEPETDLTGWIYAQYVKPVDPESKRAGLVDVKH